MFEEKVLCLVKAKRCAPCTLQTRNTTKKKYGIQDVRKAGMKSRVVTILVREGKKGVVLGEVGVQITLRRNKRIGLHLFETSDLIRSS